MESSSARQRSKRRRPASRKSDYGQRVLQDALNMASTLVDSRKQAGAEKIADIAESAREFGTSLEDLPYLRDYTEAAAAGLEEIADYIEQSDIAGIMEDIGSFARRQPLAMLALTMVAGVAATQVARNWRPFGTRRSRSSSNARSTGRRRSRSHAKAA